MFVGDVVRNYKAESSLREFAERLNQGLPDDKRITYASIGYWINQQGNPSTDYLINLLLHTRDWRFDFALECLCAIRPDVWGRPDGKMWRLAKQMRGD